VRVVRNHIELAVRLVGGVVVPIAANIVEQFGQLPRSILSDEELPAYPLECMRNVVRLKILRDVPVVEDLWVEEGALRGVSEDVTVVEQRQPIDDPVARFFLF
jgi:hypothetical protein